MNKPGIYNTNNIFDITSGKIWVWKIDKDAKYIFASAEVTNILEYCPEEIVGKSFFEIISDSKNTKNDICKIFLNGKQIFKIRNCCLSKNGRKVIQMTSGVPVFGESGKIIGCRGISRDVTQNENKSTL